MSICCHYDEGYEDGLTDAQTDGMGDGLAEDCGLMLERAAAALYAVDPMSILALECEALRTEIRRLQRKAAR